MRRKKTKKRGRPQGVGDTVGMNFAQVIKFFAR